MPALARVRSRPYLEVTGLFLISVIVMSRQLLHPQLASCVIDDSILQMSWVRQFAQGLSWEVWLPRWMPEANGGYGSPVFIFYSPLVYYLSAFFFWITESVVFSMKLVRLLGLFFSAWAMFAYASHRLSRKAAWAMAVVYLLLPFHILDVNYWTLYAEPIAWTWFPLLLLYQHRMLNDEEKSGVALALFSLCYACLILTHLVSAYLFSFVLAGSFGWHWLRGFQLRDLGRMAAGVSLGLIGAAFYLLPALYERGFVHLEYSTLLPEFDFRNTFLFFPSQSLTRGNAFLEKTLQLLRAVTLVQGVWVGFAAALILRDRSSTQSWRREASFALMVCLSCLFLMSGLSQDLWLLVPMLPQIQFSTRWLSVFTLMSAVIVGLGFEAYLRGRSNRLGLLRLGYQAGACLTLLASAFIIYGSCFVEAKHEEAAARSLLNAPEYNPRKMPHWKHKVILPEDPPVVLIQGSARTKVLEWEAHHREIRVEAEAPVRLKLRILDYPGWTIRVQPRVSGEFRDIRDGAIQLTLPPGRHQVIAKFEDTWWRQLGQGLSLSGLPLVGAYLWWERKPARRGLAREDPACS